MAPDFADSEQLGSHLAGTFAILRGQLSGAGVVGPRVHDAKIATICLAHRVTELWTADRDLSRFPGPRNPLTDS